MHFDSGPGAVPHGLHSLALGPYDLPNLSGRHQAPQHRLHRLRGLHMKSRNLHAMPCFLLQAFMEPLGAGCGSCSA